MYADANQFKKRIENEFDELTKEITIWTRTHQSITPVTKEEKIVKTLLREKVLQLQNLLSRKLFETKSELESQIKIKSQNMIVSYKITNKSLLVKCCIIFLAALILFFLHPFLDVIHLSIGWISIMSAIVLLASSIESGLEHHHSDNQNEALDLTNNNASNSENSESKQHSGIDLEALIHKVEWSTLLFFAGLFIFMKSIEELGLLSFLANAISDLVKSIENVPDRLVIAILLLTFVSALVSSIIDNIPFTTAMIPIVIQLSEQANVK
jgi:P protein